jgi:hypothetical protein
MAVTSWAGAKGFISRTPRDALRSPILAMSARHINNGHCRIDFSGNTGNVPARKFSAQIDIGNDRAITRFILLKEPNCFLPGRCDYRFKPPSERASSAIA